MHIKRTRGWEIPERLATPESIYLNRRDILKASGFSLMGGLAAGRFAGARLVGRRPPDRLVAAAYGLLLAGGAVFWAAREPVVSVAGLALLGLGVSVVFPLSMALAIGAAPPGAAEGASTRISLGASMAILAAPFALGALGDAVGPRRGFLLVPAIVLVALALIAARRPRL